MNKLKKKHIILVLFLAVGLLGLFILPNCLYGAILPKGVFSYIFYIGLIAGTIVITLLSFPIMRIDKKMPFKYKLPLLVMSAVAALLYIPLYLVVAIKINDIHSNANEEFTVFAIEETTTRKRRISSRGDFLPDYVQLTVRKFDTADLEELYLPLHYSQTAKGATHIALTYHKGLLGWKIVKGEVHFLSGTIETVEDESGQ
jgi:hypothetical protein